MGRRGGKGGQEEEGEKWTTTRIYIYKKLDNDRGNGWLDVVVESLLIKIFDFNEWPKRNILKKRKKRKRKMGN